MKNKEYWMGIIGPVENKKLGGGADGPLRSSLRDTFNIHFGQDKVCASGWGIDEERYLLLRQLHSLPTIELKQLLKK